MFKRLLKAVAEHHDVRARLKRCNPERVGHEEHRLAVVTARLHAVVAVLVEATEPVTVVLGQLKTEDVREKVVKGLRRHLAVHVVDERIDVSQSHRPHIALL